MSKVARRIKDKWRMKEWYDVYSPLYFGEVLIASIPSEEPAKLVGRTIEATLYDVTGDFAHQTIKLYFMIVRVIGERAETVMKAHEYSPDYLRSLVRRGTSRVDGIFNLATRNGFITRASIVAFTKDRINTSQKRAIRAIMEEVARARAKETDYEQLSQEMVLGKLGSDIYNEAKKIIPLRHVGVRKSKLLQFPEDLFEKPIEAGAAGGS